MGITKVAYFVYFTRDMARARAFYQDVLKLPVAYETPAWIQFRMEGGTLALHLAEEGAEEITNAHGGGIIGFTVDNLEAFAQELKGHGVRFEGEIRDEHFGRLLNILDPDGNIINLFEPAAVAQHRY